jgi:hypothetical protein
MEVGEAAPRTFRDAKNTASRSAVERPTLGYCDTARKRGSTWERKTSNHCHYPFYDRLPYGT